MAVLTVATVFNKMVFISQKGGEKRNIPGAYFN